MATRIKICGITNEEDAREAVAAGVHALGFVFAPSPRRVDPETARQIINHLPPFVTTVGVFVDEEIDVVRDVVNQCRLNVVQLHGQENKAYANGLDLTVLKAFRVSGAQVLSEIERFGCRHFLLDTFDRQAHGGTGKTSDWRIARQATALGKVILAGGLNHTNIADALAQVHPYGVDVSSGVEKHPGRKDQTKLQQFVHEVQKWDYQTTKDISVGTAAASFPKR
jgi:phosphoribosylanthranilate isomerase